MLHGIVAGNCSARLTMPTYRAVHRDLFAIARHNDWWRRNDVEQFTVDSDSGAIHQRRYFPSRASLIRNNSPLPAGGGPVSRRACVRGARPVAATEVARWCVAKWTIDDAPPLLGSEFAHRANRQGGPTEWYVNGGWIGRSGYFAGSPIGKIRLMTPDNAAEISLQLANHIHLLAVRPHSDNKSIFIIIFIHLINGRNKYGKCNKKVNFIKTFKSLA